MAKEFHSRDCINLRIRMAARVINRIFDKHTKPLGVTPSQLTILLLVDQKKAVVQSEIGKELMLERSTVTRELKGLIDKGLLEKESLALSPTVRLTKTGKAFVKQIIPSWIKANREVAALLGENGVNALGELYRAVRE